MEDLKLTRFHLHILFSILISMVFVNDLHAYQVFFHTGTSQNSHQIINLDPNKDAQWAWVSENADGIYMLEDAFRGKPTAYGVKLISTFKNKKNAIAETLYHPFYFEKLAPRTRALDALNVYKIAPQSMMWYVEHRPQGYGLGTVLTPGEMGQVRKHYPGRSIIVNSRGWSAAHVKRIQNIKPAGVSFEFDIDSNEKHLDILASGIRWCLDHDYQVHWLMANTKSEEPDHYIKGIQRVSIGLYHRLGARYLKNPKLILIPAGYGQVHPNLYPMTQKQPNGKVTSANTVAGAVRWLLLARDYISSPIEEK